MTFSSMVEPLRKGFGEEHQLCDFGQNKFIVLYLVT